MAKISAKPKAAPKSSSALKKPAAAKEKKVVAKTESKAAEAKPAVIQEKYLQSVGRRKNAIARIRLFENGEGFQVNNKTLDQYFPIAELRETVLAPLRDLNLESKFRITAKVFGGGMRGQAEALRHGVARALLVFNEEFRKRLKKAGYLKRDPRMKERRKYGLKKARRAPQWQKR